MSEDRFEGQLSADCLLDQGMPGCTNPLGNEAPQTSENMKASPAQTPCEEEGLCPQDLDERNALAQVFSDVRKQSAHSCLVQPQRWTEINLVPEHLSAEEFEMLVYEYLEEYRNTREDNLATEVEKVTPVYRSATCAVGVPRLFGDAVANYSTEEEKAGGSEIAEVDEVEVSVQQGRSLDASSLCELDKKAAVGSPSISDAPQGVPCAGELFLQSNSVVACESVTDEVFATSNAADELSAQLNIPAGYRLVELEGEYVLVPSGEEATPVELAIECENIAVLTGAQSYYVYDRGFMTDAYAHWAFLAAEDNSAITFADCVREDSRVYPRPLAATSLENPPFNMTAKEVLETWELVQESGEFPDLKTTVASNGDRYYYSTDYLSCTYAAALAEWDAVERKMNF